jgi:hypothetical protein
MHTKTSRTNVSSNLKKKDAYHFQNKPEIRVTSLGKKIIY